MRPLTNGMQSQSECSRSCESPFLRSLSPPHASSSCTQESAHLPGHQGDAGALLCLMCTRAGQQDGGMLQVHLLGKLGDWPQHGDHIDDLEGALLGLEDGLLPSDAEHRERCQVRVRDSCRRIGGARAQCCQTHSCPPCTGTPAWTSHALDDPVSLNDAISGTPFSSPSQGDAVRCKAPRACLSECKIRVAAAGLLSTA